MSSPATVPPRFNESLLLLTLAAIQFTHILDFMVMMPLGPQFIRVFGINPQQFSILVASYAFSAGATGLGASFFLDRFDRKPALLVLYAGFILGTLACSLAPNYSALLVARILTGAFGGVAGSVVFAIVGDVIPPERRGRAMGVIMSAFSAAQVLGLTLALWAANRYSWHAPFVILVVAGVIIGAIAAYSLPSLRIHQQGGEQARPLAQIRAILGRRNHLIAFALSGALTFGGSLVIPFISPWMVFNVGLGEQHLALIYLCGGVCTLFSMNIIGRWADRRGKLPVFTRMALVSIPPIILLTNLPPVPLWAALAATTVFIVTMSGRFVPASAMITGAVASRYRGGFSSMSAAVQQIAQGTATSVGGLLISRDPSGRLVGYWLAGFLSIGACLLSLWLARRLHPAETELPAAAL